MTQTYKKFLAQSKKRTDRMVSMDAKGKSLQEIADAMNVSKQRVGFVLRREAKKKTNKSA